MKHNIHEALATFSAKSLYDASAGLLHVLGYKSEKDAKAIPMPSLGDEVLECVGLFQITDEEVGGIQGGKFDDKEIYSFLFVAVALKKEHYSKTQLRKITHDINLCFSVPVIVLFSYGGMVTLSIIDFRLNKKDGTKDVLGKVTSIKDISTCKPHRAHIDILYDLSLREISKKYKAKNFAQLHHAWQKTLSLSGLSEDFYKKFIEHFEAISQSVEDCHSVTSIEAHDFTLLFAIRTIFLSFVQKRGWIGEDDVFLQTFLKAYKTTNVQEKFYSHWLSVLFFEALNQPPGTNFSSRGFSKEIETVLNMSPYLNGGLFQKKSFDKLGLCISDAMVENFFEFLEGYKFTLQENTPLDVDIDLTPEFLGIIFERLVNKADGAIYTDRLEVELMCKLSLLSWLEQQTTLSHADISHLLFMHQSDHLTKESLTTILKMLESVCVCDPAVGSGAFPLGMLEVIDGVEQTLREAIGDEDFLMDGFDRKKRIIQNTLYGVEVKEWAVWITQLRLWLRLFIDAPDALKESFEPILPSLDFKIRQGDSLVQKIGSKAFPLSGHAQLSPVTKAKVTKLKHLKIDYFKNRIKDYSIVKRAENELFRDILNEEIEAKKASRKQLTQSKTQEPSLFGGMEQKTIHLFEDELKAIDQEIKELISEKESLKDEHPLIWNIEFAEVFADKGGFDIVIGNPPYVRQEAISDPLGKMKIRNEKDEEVDDNKGYKNALMEMASLDFPDFFRGKNMPSGRSDLSLYFYIRGLRLLNKKGKLCYICTNSWLDVDYGAKLQELLLNYAPLEQIIDNHAKRSFESADVNTIISLIGAPMKKVSDKHLARFIAFKKPFEEIDYHRCFTAILNQKETMAEDDFRVYCTSNAELFASGYEGDEEGIGAGGNYAGEKWGGKFLRAPEIFFTIVQKGKDKLVKLGDIADVRRGFTTGANDFFYLDKKALAQWEIEEEFLRPVVTSSTECNEIAVDETVLPYKAFMCYKSKKELIGTQALKYIKYGENKEIEIKKGKDKDSKIIGYHNIQSTKNRKNWYSLPLQKKADFVALRFRDLRNWSPIVQGNFGIGDTVFIGSFNDVNLAFNGNLILNSTMNVFISEIMGRINLGDGLLTTYGSEIKKFILVNPKIIDFSLFDFDTFSKRKIESIFIECGIDPYSDIPIEEQIPKPLPDRAQLDTIVFDALNLNNDERIQLYRSVCRLVWNRISKAKSV